MAIMVSVDEEAASERLGNMPKVTQLVKGWAGIRIIMADIYWLVSRSYRLSILIYDLTEVSQQPCEVSSVIISSLQGGTDKF